jgi:Rieske 2Fe-2S family protein
MADTTPKARQVETGVSKEHFVTPEWHERDLAAVFRPRWHYAAHVSELAQPGSYLTFRLADDEVVITRAATGDLVAYYNYCRHRGYQLVSEPRGELRRNFVCQYHGWSYSRDSGACLSATRMNDDFDRSPWGLRRAWVENFHGFIFVSLADERPTPVAEATRSLLDTAGGIRGFDLDRLKVAASSDTEIGANWKIVKENDDECYHCALNHPELVENYDPWSGFTVVADLDLPQHLWTGDEWSITELGESKFSSEPDCRIPLARNDRSNGDEVMTIQFFWAPSGHLIFNPDYVWVFSIKPLGPQKTLLTQQWLVHEDAQEGADYDVQSLVSFFDITMKQDKRLCEGVQRGLRMRHFTPGPLNPHHQAPAIEFYRWYEKCLAVA